MGEYFENYAYSVGHMEFDERYRPQWRSSTGENSVPLGSSGPIDPWRITWTPDPIPENKKIGLDRNVRLQELRNRTGRSFALSRNIGLNPGYQKKTKKAKSIPRIPTETDVSIVIHDGSDLIGEVPKIPQIEPSANPVDDVAMLASSLQMSQYHRKMTSGIAEL